VNGIYLLAIAAIVAGCFWKPDFPKRLAAKAGLRNERGMRVFLILYWISIPIVIHRLMSLVRLE
jgi:hypothetical protein